MNESTVGVPVVDIPFFQNQPHHQPPFRSLDVSALDHGARSPRRRRKSPKKNRQKNKTGGEPSLAASPTRDASRPRKGRKKGRKSARRNSQSPDVEGRRDSQMRKKRGSAGESADVAGKGRGKGRNNRAGGLNRSVQLPKKINTDSEAEFVKLFLEKNNKQYRQPKQKKANKGLSPKAQNRNAPRESPREMDEIMETQEAD